jgi:toxin YoeB
MNVTFSKKFRRAFDHFKNKDSKKAQKISQLIDSILEHPQTGIGKVEHLEDNIWSRRIDKKNRLVYVISGDTIFFKSCQGHYDDH